MIASDIKRYAMKSWITLIFVFVLADLSIGQSVLTLRECYERAEINYPLIRQRALIEKTTAFSVENALKGRLPQISIGGQASYQSEVTEIPVEMPGVEPISKDQYRIFGEIAQTIYHGGLVAKQKESVKLSNEVDMKKLEVDIYQIRDRINDLFFGILLFREQIRLTELIKRDLNAGLRRTEAAIANGTALQSSADDLRAELLKVDQRIIDIEYGEEAYRQILGNFIGESVAESVLEKPEFSTSSAVIERPELGLFDLQSRSIQANMELLTAQKKPRLQLFVQGGYGRPGLNMLENEFDFYYLGGLRFNWMLSGYFTLRRERDLLSLRQQSIDVQKETFLFNTSLALRQIETEIARLSRLIEVDDAIITLRAGIRETAAVQLEEGVISSSDYVREANAEDQARQNRALHETQMLMAQAERRFNVGQTNTQ